MTILVVDDYVQVREVMRLMLEGRGHTVLTAEGGEEALRLFAEREVDLAFVDMDMPRMNGLEVCRALLARAETIGARLSAWLMTGVTRPELTAGAVAVGALGVVAKPFTTAELVACIDAACGVPGEAAEIPQQIAAHRAQLAQIASVNSAHHGDAPLASRAFLVVDDNEDHRFLAAHALRKGIPGSRVVECSTIDEALRACKRARFDGVLTDHHLADQNGPAFMAQLRAAGVRCPVVVVTGSSNPEVHARAYAAGASRVFFGSEMDFTGYFRRKFQAGT